MQMSDCDEVAVGVRSNRRLDLLRIAAPRQPEGNRSEITDNREREREIVGEITPMLRCVEQQENERVAKGSLD